MATGGEVQGQCPGSSGSEDLDELKCQPCLEDGNLHQAVGMCVDCQDYLCLKCYEGHTLPKPCRNHQLLDREQMIQSQIKPTLKDACKERCSIHDDEFIKYYCLDHYFLGCSACITLDHKNCHRVQYIPHVAKELASNTEYKQIENELRSALEAFKQVSENTKQNADELNTSCTTALESIRKYRKMVEEAFDKIEAKLIETAQEMKSKELLELQAINDKYKLAEEELHAAVAKVDALQSAKQNCSSYTEMMRAKDKLQSMDAEIKEAEIDKTYRCQIQFTPNQGILDTLKNTDVLGILSGSGARPVEGRNRGPIVGAIHIKDINVETGNDTYECEINGLVALPGNMLVVADHKNGYLKAVDVDDGQVIAQLNLSFAPWDICAISNDKVAVCIPSERNIAIVAVDNKLLSIDRKLIVGGTCYGIDYRNDKLAVSFQHPAKVEILNLQGTVLYDISCDKLGQDLFDSPLYVTYGQDDTTLFVSNYHGNSLVCVKLDGTVLAINMDIQWPCKTVTDSKGHIYLCTGASSNIKQISKDCKMLQELSISGLDRPSTMCLSEEKDILYVGAYSDNVKIYKPERAAQ